MNLDQLRTSFIFLQLGLIQLVFPKLQKYAPRLAEWWTPRLFFNPPRFPIPKHEKEILDSAEQSAVEVNGKKVRVYRWGEGPAVLLVHGWAGRAGNFSHFIPKLVEKGYQVIAFDAPAHGVSEGKDTNLIEFRDVVIELDKKEGPLAACIGHSLGGIALYQLAIEELKIGSLILLAASSRQDNIFGTFFCRRLNGNLSTVPFLKKWVIANYGFDFDTVFPLHQHPLNGQAPLLIVHDKGDKDVEVEDARLFHEANPGSLLKITDGLGHFKILQDDDVIDQCVRFIGRQSFPS